MSIQNNPTSATPRGVTVTHRSREEADFERHFNALKNNSAHFDNAGFRFMDLNRNDGKIERRDLEALMCNPCVSPEVRDAAKYFLNNAVAWQKLDSAGEGKSDGVISFDNIASMDTKLKAEAQKRTEEAQKARDAAPKKDCRDGFDTNKAPNTPNTDGVKRSGGAGGYPRTTIKATEHALQTLHAVLNALQMAQNGSSNVTGPQIKDSLKQAFQDPNTPQGVKDLLNKVINHPMFTKAFTATAPNVGQGTAPGLTPTIPWKPVLPVVPQFPNNPTPSLPAVPNSQPSAPSGTSTMQRGDGPITKEQYGMMDDANKRVEDLKQKLNNSGKIQSKIRELEQQMSKETDGTKKEALQQEINKLKESGGDREMLMMEYKEAMQQKEQMFQFLMSILSHQDKMFQSFIQNLR